MWLFHGCDPSLTFLTAKSSSSDPGKPQPPPVGALATAKPCPAGEIESLLVALLAVTHNAAMECYRLGMSPDQKLESRRESLSQASELVRSYAALVQAIGRHRGQCEERAGMAG